MYQVWDRGDGWTGCDDRVWGRALERVKMSRVKDEKVVKELQKPVVRPM